MRANGYGADLELTQDALVIHAGKVVATVQGTQTVTIPLTDIERIEWKEAGRLVNGRMRVFVWDGVDLRSYGPQPNVISAQSLVVHWRRKDRAAFEALREQLDRLGAGREPSGRPVEAQPSRQEGTGSRTLNLTTGAASDEQALREQVKKAKRGELKLEAFELWNGSGGSVEVVGEAYHRRALAALYKPRGRRSGEEFWTSAVLVAEVDNAHDPNAVRVDIEGHTVGHLAREDAMRYRPYLVRLVLEGQASVVKARVWATDADGTWRGRVALQLGEPATVIPANAHPGEPTAELPEGRTIQVTGEDEHLDVLGPLVVSGQTTALWCTLHATTIKGPRSEKRVVEVRVDGHTVGTLTPTTSAGLLTVIDRAEILGRIVLAHGLLSGNSLTASMTLSAPRTENLTEEWIREHLNAKA